jgi:hypothetical protein
MTRCADARLASDEHNTAAPVSVFAKFAAARHAASRVSASSSFIILFSALTAPGHRNRAYVPRFVSANAFASAQNRRRLAGGFAFDAPRPEYARAHRVIVSHSVSSSSSADGADDAPPRDRDRVRSVASASTASRAFTRTRIPSAAASNANDDVSEDPRLDILPPSSSSSSSRRRCRRRRRPPALRRRERWRSSAAASIPIARARLTDGVEGFFNGFFNTHSHSSSSLLLHVYYGGVVGSPPGAL